jgi:hypothetical protein
MNTSTRTRQKSPLVKTTTPIRRGKKGLRSPELPEIIADPVESAKAAGLRYVSDERPGIRRKRVGKNFTYIDPDGQTVRDEKHWRAFVRWPFRLPTKMFGFARWPMAICKRPASTTVAASSIAIIRAGARCATKLNTRA